MKNVRDTIWQQRLPSLMGLFVLVFSIGTIGWLSQNAIILGSKAATGSIPHNVQVSNISDTSFTVSYLTDEKVIGSISYGIQQPLSEIALDDRDQKTSVPQKYLMHHITIRNVTPATKYLYTITSGDQSFSNSSTSYEVTTASKLDAKTSTQQSLVGTVNLEDGSVPGEAIAYVQSDTSQLFSNLVSPDGGYRIELNTMRVKDLSSLLSFTKDTILRLSVASPTLKSQISLLASQSNPVPLVLLAKDYDFAVSTQALSSNATDSASPSGDFPIVNDTIDTNAGPQILSPKADQTYKDQQPLFTGTASPNQTVTITIQSIQKIQASTQTDNNGAWHYRPTTKLDPGAHTITIETPDLSGTMQKLSQSFTVFASGSEFTEPSISPTLPISPAPSASAAPTINQTPTPPIVPTSTPSATPTFVPSPTSSVSPTLMQPIPPTGSNSLVMSIIGITSAVGIGALLFFFTMI